jgi:RHS repeat-associated protein
LAHDAWGKRRSANGISDTTDSLVGLTTDRGFTLHEHLDEMGVVHMNGRIYDPLIGRVMSADPFIQAPSMLQSHNRYSYVMNNPLNLTDPSGYFSFRKFLGYAVFGIHGGSSTVRTGITMALCSYGPATCGAATAMNAYISGASTRQALRSGGVALLSALAFQAAGGVGPEGATAEEAARSVERYAAHATAGCVSAAMGGGQCGTGAVSAVVGKFTSNQIAGIGAQDLGGDIARGIATSVAGGVGSVIAGGKFENGAKTAAYGYLFNELLTLGDRREAMLRAGHRDGGSTLPYDQPLERICPECNLIGLGGAIKGAVGLFEVAASRIEQLLVTDVTKVLVNVEGRGGIGAAEKFFDALPRNGGVSAAETPLGVVRSVELQGGGTASIRPFSQTNPSGATVQINAPGARTIKIRYD